ncbi:MAG TPA: hypothetical protein VJZ71_01395 [Phycisphaerae bacterium]|nr:hypothetical protein [Phycisphaerae bacterium]
MKPAARTRKLVSSAVLAAALVVHLACDTIPTEPELLSCGPAQVDAIPRPPAGLRTGEATTERSILVDYRDRLRFRDWTGTNWGPLQAMPGIPSEARWVVTRNCPTVSCGQIACGVIDQDRDAFVLLFNGSTWGEPLPIAQNVTSNETIRALDMAYLSSSRLLVVYGTRNRGQLGYRLGTGSGSVTTEQILDIPGAGNLGFVALYVSPRSDQAILLVLDSNKDLFLVPWTGIGWGTVTTLTTNAAADNTECFAAAFEGETGRALVVYGEDGASSASSVIVECGSASSAVSVPLAPASDNNLAWCRLAADPFSNTILFAATKRSGVLMANEWNGSVWGASQEFATTPFSDRRTFDIAFQVGAPQAVIAYGIDGTNTWALRTWNFQGWSEQFNAGRNVGSRPGLISLVPGQSVGEIFTFVSNEEGVLGHSLWTGNNFIHGIRVNGALPDDGRTQAFMATGRAPIAVTEPPDVLVTIPGGALNLAEGGDAVAISLALNPAPSADVHVSVFPGAQLDIGSGPGVSRQLTFPACSANVPQVFSVIAFDDEMAEGTHMSQLSYTLNSIDQNYNAFDVPPTPATIADNDVAAIIFSALTGTQVREGTGDAVSYTCKLGSQPMANVLVTITPPTGLNVGPGLGTGPGVPIVLTFTPSNFKTPQTITVRSIDDQVANGTRVLQVTHTSSSSDAAYNAQPIANVSVTVLDDDVAGVQINPPGGGLNVSEGSAVPDTYSLVLTSEPVADVVITVQPDGQLNLGAGPGIGVPLTFTPANWNAPQVVSVLANDDPVAEGNHSGGITHNVASADPAYAALSVPNVAVQITDNEVAGVTVTQSGGTTQVSEGGATDTFTVVLNSQPSATVTINVTPDNQVDLGSGAGIAIPLLFTAANWNLNQTMTVAAVDDAVAEGVHVGTIALTSASADPAYSGLPIPGFNVQIFDNDSAAVLIVESENSTAVTEGGATDSLTVRLASQPTADVTITLSPDPQLDVGSGGGLPLNLLFTSVNWQTPQPVNVVAVDDAVAEGPHIGAIGITTGSADLLYNGLVVPDVVVQITDNDAAGVRVTETDGTTQVTEAGIGDSFDVQLNSQPTSDVTITVTPDGQLDLGAGAGMAVLLMFTTATWDTPQTVAVAAMDDFIAEGTHSGSITFNVASLDGAYHGTAVPDVSVQITDNDLAGVLVTQSGGSTSVVEGGSADSFTFALSSQPGADVTITVTPGIQLTLGAGPGVAIARTFTPLNWQTPQQVNVLAAQDDIAEGTDTAQIAFSVASVDTAYDGLAVPDISVQITDNITAAVFIIESGGMTLAVEGGPSDDFLVLLGSQPVADVTITVTPDAQLDLGSGAGLPINIVFTSLTWDIQRQVSVSAVDDAAAEGQHSGSISFATASADPNYDLVVIPDVVAQIFDNDVAGVSLVESDNVTEVAEGGATDSFTIGLSSQPVADVTINVSPDSQLDLGSGPGVAVTLTFTTANWDLAQAVTALAVDDAIAEGPHTGAVAIQVASADGAYDELVVPGVSVQILDNDSTGVVISESGNDTSVNETGPTSDDFSVQLSSEPTADVNVTLATTARLDLGAGPGLPLILTFTSANWNIPQTVNVTAVDDVFADGSGIIDIAFAVGSFDTSYAGMLVPPVHVNLIDNDAAGLTNSTGGQALQVSEEGPTSENFSVVLDSEPHADVVVQVNHSDQMDLGAGPGVAVSLTFTPAAWNVPQLVTVTAVDDFVAEGPHAANINFTLVSADPVYDGLAAAFVAVAIADNDQAGLTFPDGTGWLHVAEGGGSAAYSIVLTSQPRATVTVAIQPDAQLNLGTGQAVAVGLTFTAGNWNVPQQIDVMAVDDADAEGLHSGLIQCQTASADPNYDSPAIPDVIVVIDDNDAGDVEGGGGDGSDECPIPPEGAGEIPPDDHGVCWLSSFLFFAPVCGTGCMVPLIMTFACLVTARARKRIQRTCRQG